MVTLPVDFWEESIGTVAQRWLYEDDVSASAWIDQLRPDMRDVTIVSCCRAAMSGHQSADEVIKLGLTISDHSVRDAVLGELVRSLQTTTPGAMSASERISELSISEEQKAYLRKFIRRNADGR
jgi:hypothetical protein